MDFSNSTTEDGIIQEIHRICGSNDDLYPVKAQTARVNQGLDRFMYLALKYDKNWNFDDLNQTDLPIGVQDLNSDQYDYEFADEVLIVDKVMIKDSNGDWKILPPMNMSDADAEELLKQASSNTGTPIRYAKFAHSILLDPKPNYDSTDGLKVFFRRNAVRFVSTDTDTEPGIPSIFHPYLCWMGALPHLIKHIPGEAIRYMKLIGSDNPRDPYYGGAELAIADYFSMRGGDVRGSLVPNVENCK